MSGQEQAPRPAARGLWSARINDLLESAPLRLPQTYREAGRSQSRAFAEAHEAVVSALATGCGVDAYRLLLQKRALARTDEELHGSRRRVEYCALRIAAKLIAAGCGT